MASLECECTDIEGHKKREQKKLQAGVDINRYQNAEEPITVRDLQETLLSPSIKVESYRHAEIAGQEINSQNSVTAEGGINRYQEASVKPVVSQDLKETSPIHSNEEKSCECTDFERPKVPPNAVTTKVDVNQYREEVKPAAAHDLKEPFHSHANEENLDIDSCRRQDDVDINQSERMKPGPEQGLKETFASHENQANPPKYADIVGQNNFEQNTVMTEIDNQYQDAVNSPAVQDLIETIPKHAKQENPCKYTDIQEPKKCAQITMTAENDINGNQEAVKPITVQEVKETFPGRAKREPLEYTDFERPKISVQNTATDRDDLNRYEKPKSSTVQNEKETWGSHAKQDEQDEFSDVDGFECYEPNTLKPGIHINRYQEAKKSPTLQSLRENLSNRYLGQGNRAKSSEDTKPCQSSMHGKSNNKVRTGFSSYVSESQQREGLRKSEGATVVTLQDLAVPTPFEQCRLIRLKLKSKAKGKCEPEAIQEAKARIEELFQSPEADLDLEEDSDQGARERNEKQLDEIFDGIEQKIRLLRIEVKKKFRTLTPKQKKQVLKFWEGVEEFIDVLLDWISKMFIKILGDIRQGSILEKDEIKKVFKDVAEFLKIIF